ncbi:MAG: serine hydrolase, partial [Xanthomonadales bacterium]|nr:serine hydrolase [Xanthomonadales bacterium]
LFEPLGMTRSNFSVAASQNDPDHARPHYANDDDQLEEIPFRSIDLVGPAGSVNSSVNEMARWLRFNLDGGRVGGKALISQAALADIQSPHMTLPDASTRGDIVPVGYAMGWEVSVYRGHRRVAHGGGIDGFATSVVLFPDDHLGLVAFTNSGSVLPDLFNRMAADRILGLESVEWVGEALERHRKRKAIQDDAESKRDADRKANTKPSHPITEYAGSYAHPGYGVLTISGAPGKAALSMSFNGIDAPLEHWHYDVWKGTETDGDGTFQETKLLFRTDYSGDISAVEVPLERAAAPIVFTKQPDPQLSDPAYLQRFVGDYNDAETGTPDLIALSGNQLQLILPGQPVYTLVPAVSGRFDIKGLQGYAVGFTLDADGQVLKITYYQPNGVFESARVKE